jgi:tRNA (guanosine-2'-O-)-methyltransferase
MDPKKYLCKKVGMTAEERKVFDHLSRFVSDHKKNFVDRVLDERTRYVTVVLENIYQSQNASAVVRTCECMGLQDIHIVENTAKYDVNVRVLKGSNKWINLERYRAKGVNNTQVCFDRLRKDGYRILVADPSEDGVSIHDLDVSKQKLALVFGNELRGASDYALMNSDQKIRIPMFGFTESLNISASVAICLNTILANLRSSLVEFKLNDEEKQSVKLNWYRKIVKRSDLLEREFLRTIQ